MFRAVEHLLQPKSIAIVGASEGGGAGWAKAVFDNLAYRDFPVPVYLINPRRTELWGRPVYPGFAALPQAVDLAVSIIPAAHVPETLTEAAHHGLKCALIYAAQFGEGGDAEGAIRAKALRALGTTYGLRVSGPNCMGSLAIREGLLLYPSARVRALTPGPVGVVFQSGGTFQFWLQQASVRGLGFSYAVSSGNELDLDLADYINFMVEDRETKIIACMIEGIRRPDAFVAVAEKALAARKPILAVKIGRTEAARAAAASHTGALAGDDRIFDALCQKYGIVRCHSLDDLMETCLAFTEGRLPAGNRIAMVGYSGGAKGLFLDYATEEGAELAILAQETKAALSGRLDKGLPAENPLDAGAQTGMQGDKFTAICKLVAADPNVDMLAVHGQLPIAAHDPMDARIYAEISNATDKPIVGLGRFSQNVSGSAAEIQREAGMPFLQGLPETIRALQGLAHYAAVRRKGIAPLAAAGSTPGLDDAALAAVLAENGITPPRGGVAPSLDAAAQLSAEVGFPVALKIVSPSAVHKTEVGGVALHLTDTAAVHSAGAAMVARLKDHDPAAVVDGFLVQEMVQGLETIVGVREDPLYGPFLVLGLGGIFVEVLKDVAVRLLPVDEASALDMVRSLRSAPLFGPFRGSPARDLEAFSRAVAGLSRVFATHRNWISDLEINPLIVLAEGRGVCAVDIRTVRRPPIDPGGSSR